MREKIYVFVSNSISIDFAWKYTQAIIVAATLYLFNFSGLDRVCGCIFGSPTSRNLYNIEQKPTTECPNGKGNCSDQLTQVLENPPEESDENEKDPLSQLDGEKGGELYKGTGFGKSFLPEFNEDQLIFHKAFLDFRYDFFQWPFTYNCYNYFRDLEGPRIHILAVASCYAMKKPIKIIANLRELDFEKYALSGGGTL